MQTQEAQEPGKDGLRVSSEMNCTTYCQNEVNRYVAEYKSVLRKQDMMEIKKYKNRANIYEGKELFENFRR